MHTLLTSNFRIMVSRMHPLFEGSDQLQHKNDMFSLHRIVIVSILVLSCCAISTSGADASPPIGTALTGVPATTLAPITPPTPPKPVVVTYFASWTASKARNTSIDHVDLRYITHLVYAFATVSIEGKCMLDAKPGSIAESSLQRLKQIKKANPHLRTLLGLGGWTDSGVFSDVALTNVSRASVSKSCTELVQMYEFDGIDVDWEYPVEGGMITNHHRPEDADNYPKLLKALRDSLGKKRLLTIAYPAQNSFLKRLQFSKLVEHLDWVNFMLYDSVQATSLYTAHHVPLYSNPLSQMKGHSVVEAVGRIRQAGVAAKYIVIGLPFYGRGWTNVTFSNTTTEANVGLFQPCLGAITKQHADGTLSYAAIQAHRRATNTIWSTFWDTVSHANVIYSRERREMITYESIRSIRAKAAWAIQNKLRGVMAWEFSMDLNSELQKAMYTALFEEYKKPI